MDAYLPFRSRDYRLLLAGNFLSVLGLQMMSVAVGWDLYVATKSAVVLGNVGVVQVAPFLLFALTAGHMADRYDRRRILMVTQALLAGALIVLAFASRQVWVNKVWVIYACLFLTAAARAFQSPARMSMLPLVVPQEVLGKAIAWNSSAQEIASVSGPALAGLVIALAGTTPVYVALGGFGLCTFLCFTLLRVRKAVPVVKPPDVPVTEGLRFLWTNKLLLAASSLDLFAVLFGGATALLPIYAVDILHAGPTGLGWLRAAPSIGAVGMAFVLAHSRRIEYAGRALLLCVAGFGLATVVFGVSRSVVLSFLALVLTGAFDNVSVVLRQSLLQTRTPDHVRGRVMAVNGIFINCSNQLGAVESGWTAAWFGPVASVVGGGLASIAIVGLYWAKSRQLHNWKQ